MRAVGPPLQLWDVRNVEAHVARALDAGLDQRSARLSASQYDRCFQFCLQKCWELSGLEGDGKTLRYEWEITGFFRPAGALDQYEPFRLRYSGEAAAELALADLRAKPEVSFVRLARVRPKGAYDRRFGLLFSTYSWRAIVNYKIDDWYRSDPEFGDTRYASNRRDEESLEALAARVFADDDRASDELPAPLGRLEVVDQLNPHAYQDAGEEVLTREAFGFRG